MPFRDIGDSAAKDAIMRLYEQHLIDGIGDGMFAPAKPITRAEMATLIVRAFRLDAVDAAIPAFTDVKRDAWHYRWVHAAVQTGIVSGVTTSRFEPNRLVLRQEAAVMLARALKLSTGGSGIATLPRVYEDQDRIASYAVHAVLRLKELGLMQGDGVRFRPLAPLTRQEAAIMLDQVLRRSHWAGQLKSTANMRIQLGWQYASTTAAFKEQVANSAINTIVPRWLFLDKDGLTNNGVDADLIAWAHRNGKQVWVMVGNRFHAQTTHDWIAEASKRSALVKDLVDVVVQNGIDGLNVDFENVAAADRKAFTAFIAELGAALRKSGATLSVDLPPDTSSDWSAAYEYAALGKHADYIVMMGYDEHWSGGSAGSVSSLPWLHDGLNKLAGEVPADKIILGLPLYTRDWTVPAASSGGKTTSKDWTLRQQNEAVRSRGLTPVWNGRIAQYTAQFMDNGQQHKLWLEDGRSLAAKVMMGEQVGVAGYAYWYIGAESPDVWTSVRNAMRISGYRFQARA